MRDEIEKRLHRVKITLNTDDIKCPYSHNCDKAANEKRCNEFYEKCSFYRQKKED